MQIIPDSCAQPIGRSELVGWVATSGSYPTIRRHLQSMVFHRIARECRAHPDLLAATGGPTFSRFVVTVPGHAGQRAK